MNKDEELKLLKDLAKTAEKNTTATANFVLENQKYFSEDGIRLAKEYLSNLSSNIEV